LFIDVIVVLVPEGCGVLFLKVFNYKVGVIGFQVVKNDWKKKFFV